MLGPENFHLSSHFAPRAFIRQVRLSTTKTRLRVQHRNLTVAEAMWAKVGALSPWRTPGIAQQSLQTCGNRYPAAVFPYRHCNERRLHKYLAEFDFRYNNRVALGINDSARAAKALAGAKGKRLYCREPV
jgi:hypothetical protein